MTPSKKSDITAPVPPPKEAVTCISLSCKSENLATLKSDAEIVLYGCKDCHNVWVVAKAT